MHIYLLQICANYPTTDGEVAAMYNEEDTLRCVSTNLVGCLVRLSKVTSYYVEQTSMLELQQVR
jgi:hypothetical protein